MFLAIDGNVVVARVVVVLLAQLDASILGFDNLQTLSRVQATHNTNTFFYYYLLLLIYDRF
jgi:hypothetical protein